MLACLTHISFLHAAGLHLPNLRGLDAEQAEELLADILFNDNDLSEYASISQNVSIMFVDVISSCIFRSSH